MSVVIVDTNTWGPVFDCANGCHSDFAAVRTYILATKASMAWGGTGYITELKKAVKYLGIHLELTKGGRAIRFAEKLVDDAAAKAKAGCDHRDFDDSHIIGLQIASRADVIVSSDRRAYPFFKRKDLYPKGHQRPKIYSKARNANLLG